MAESDRLARDDVERLYYAAGPRLLAYLERRTGDPARAADVFQDVFTGLVERPPRAGSAAELKSYLYRAANSRLIDHARRERRRTIWGLRALGKGSAGAVAVNSDVQRAFAALKARDAALLWLAYVEEMTHNEIAAAVDVRPASVKVLLSRARKRFRDSLTARGLAPQERS